MNGGGRERNGEGGDRRVMALQDKVRMREEEEAVMHRTGRENVGARREWREGGK